MSFLTPLYIAGALAVALPILFHLIRRTPQKRQTFSSLMFLAPTPPRFTKRSRLSNILLLILRAAALILLALAFARPFLSANVATAQSGPPGRRIALLVDTSASMRRGDLWAQAQKHVEQALADVAQADEVALFFFDRGVRPAFTFEQWNRLDPAQRVASVRAKLADTRPTWAATYLGESLASVAEQLAATEGADGSKDSIRRTIVLISDLQQGSHAEALQGHGWPDAVTLEIKPVSIDESSNASAQLIRPQPDAPDAADDRPRVRVSNSAGSTAEQFSLAWANDAGPLPTTRPQQVYVAPGRGQVVRVDWPAPETRADRLLLQGDAVDFDNTLYVVRPRQAVVRLVYLGDDAADDPRGLAFYLRSALGDTPQRKVEFLERRADTPAAGLTGSDLDGAGLVVIAKPLPDEGAALVRQFVEAGGDVLWVVLDPAAGRSLARVTGIDAIEIGESQSRDFALVGRVDLEHPLFSAFADVRFGDFSRIHFWKHRKMKFPDAAGAKTLASFDDGDPFLVEKLVGKGRVVVAASGWQPADSQLALSTKFVPILDALLSPSTGAPSDTQLTVGDTIPPPRSTASATGPTTGPATEPSNLARWTLQTPDGREIDLAGAPANAHAVDRPGVYTLAAGARDIPVAVNLDPDESRTTPLSPTDFRQWGAKFDAGPVTQALAEQQRQLKYFELENRQKMWQWLLVGVLGLVAAETALAGRLARRTVPVPTES